MNDRTMQIPGEGEYYLIAHIVLFTGLSERTVRHYLSLGVLQGEKINGLWHFTPEQVENFVNHPAVKPSIAAKKNAVIYDFLSDTFKKEDSVCIILDAPQADEKEMMEFFSYEIPRSDLHDFRMEYSTVAGIPRMILKGPAKETLALARKWMEREK